MDDLGGCKVGTPASHFLKQPLYVVGQLGPLKKLDGSRWWTAKRGPCWPEPGEGQATFVNRGANQRLGETEFDFRESERKLTMEHNILACKSCYLCCNALV